jgi:toxin ParE1/3/4
VSVELGNAFVRELSTALETRAASASERQSVAWRRIDPGRRIYVLTRFPYLVIARIKQTALRIVAVAHQRRKPGYWLERDRQSLGPTSGRSSQSAECWTASRTTNAEPTSVPVALTAKSQAHLPAGQLHCGRGVPANLSASPSRVRREVGSTGSQ